MEYPKHHKKEALEEISKQEEPDKEIKRVNEKELKESIEKFLRINPLNEVALGINEGLLENSGYPLQDRTLVGIRASFDPEKSFETENLEEVLLAELDLADTAHMPRSLRDSSFDKYTLSTYKYVWGKRPEDLWHRYLIYGENQISTQNAAKDQISSIKEGFSLKEEEVKAIKFKNSLERKRDWIKKLENGLLNVVITQKISKKFHIGEDTIKEAYQIGMKLFEDGIKTLNEIGENERQERLPKILEEKKAGFYEVKEVEPGEYRGNPFYTGERSYPFFVDDKRRFMEERDESKFLEGKEDIESISYIKYLDDELLFHVSKGLLEKNVGNGEEAKSSFEKVIGLYAEATKKLSSGAKKLLATENFKMVRKLHREIGTSYLNLGLIAIKEGKAKDEYARYFRKAEQSYSIYGDSDTYMPRLFKIYDIYEDVKDYRTRLQKRI